MRLPIPWPVRFGRQGWKRIEYSFLLNPGPWNIKEHVLVYIMANSAVGNPYTLNAIVVAEVLYNVRCGFLVWPASMVWP